MPGIFDIWGGPQFGMRDTKVAKWNGNGTWGTPVDIPSIQQINAQVQTQTAQLTGDDRITATHAKVIGGQVTFQHGSFSMNVMDVISGDSSASSGTTPNRTRRLALGNKNFPYFGLCCAVDAVEGVGDMWIFLPKVKLTQGFNAQAQYGQFMIPSLTAEFLIDDFYVVNGEAKCIDFLMHETITQISTFPPSYP